MTFETQQFFLTEAAEERDQRVSGDFSTTGIDLFVDKGCK